jgi:hypothetical protein
MKYHLILSLLCIEEKYNCERAICHLTQLNALN